MKDDSKQQLDLEESERLVLEQMAAQVNAARSNFYDKDRIPGKVTGINTPLKLLLIGYCGVGNLGADIRMAEIIRQIQSIFSAEDIQLFYTCNEPIKEEPFASISRIPGNINLSEIVCDYDGVLVCEGSLFKSNFSNVMTISYIGALGIAAAEGKVSVAYGAEAGSMHPEVAQFASNACSESLVIARSENSYREVTQKLGLRGRLGADTAWTFQAAPAEKAKALLRQSGWDGEAKLVCIAPINPFWWPVRPDLEKALALKESGKYKDIHCRSIFFHTDSEERRTQYSNYIKAIKTSMLAYCKESGAFPVIIGMEQLDRRACVDLQSGLDGHPPIFLSGDYSSREIVSILRLAFVVVSSRYHALVTSMSAGVPGIGLSMDERINNLLHESGGAERVIWADDERLQTSLTASLQDVEENRLTYFNQNKLFVAHQLHQMGKMGEALCAEIQSKHPNVKVKSQSEKPVAYVPNLTQNLSALV